jgi:hypothetical protein
MGAKWARLACPFPFQAPKPAFQGQSPVAHEALGPGMARCGPRPVPTQIRGTGRLHWATAHGPWDEGRGNAKQSGCTAAVDINGPHVISCTTA